jgi:hypothetical protein
LLVLLGYYYHSIKTLDADSTDEEYLSIIQVGINILLLNGHQSIYLTKKCIMVSTKIIIIWAYAKLAQVGQ